MEPRPGGHGRIGGLGCRVGVSPELLRARERRYGLLLPTRSAGGFRLYSEADEGRIHALQRHIGRGLSAAQAARFGKIVPLFVPEERYPTRLVNHAEASTAFASSHPCWVLA
jgi:hypothetical protein